MKILGIDPGTKRVGYGIVDCRGGNEFLPLEFGCLEPVSNNEREILEDIFDSLSKIIKKHKPDLISLEKIFFFKNQKTIISVSQARGVVLLASQKNKTPIFEPTPLEIKTCLTGYGRADKKAVSQMVQKILKLKEIPKLDDTTDALACAVTAFYLNKFK